MAKAKTGKIVNRKELSDIIGCALTTVDEWIGEGMPIKQKGTKGIEYQFDTADVISWMMARERDKMDKRSAKGGDSEELMTSNEAKRRLDVAKALSAELELSEAMGLVRPVEMIARVLSNEIANARARLLAIPSKMRPDIHLEVGNPEGTRKLVNIADRLIYEALTEIKISGDTAKKEAADV
jgi:phage terminase Nu1 subunit (DNA packaging protein)